MLLSEKTCWIVICKIALLRLLVNNHFPFADYVSIIKRLENKMGLGNEFVAKVLAKTIQMVNFDNNKLSYYKILKSDDIDSM